MLCLSPLQVAHFSAVWENTEEYSMRVPVIGLGCNGTNQQLCMSRRNFVLSACGSSTEVPLTSSGILSQESCLIYGVTRFVQLQLLPEDMPSRLLIPMFGHGNKLQTGKIEKPFDVTSTTLILTERQRQ